MPNEEVRVTSALDLELALERILRKQSRVKRLWDYYWGDHPLKYSSERLRDMFDTIDVRFVENWCQVVIDSAMDRIDLMGFMVAHEQDLIGLERGDIERRRKRTEVGATMTTALNGVFRDTELFLDAHDVHLASLVLGEAYVFVWMADDGEIEAYYNDASATHIEYRRDKPREKRFAAKLWEGENGDYVLGMYYPEAFEFYVAKKKEGEILKVTDFVYESRETNPTNVIPIFHFRRSRIKIAGELDGILTLQDAINKLLSDMMVAAEFGAFPQRYIISQAEVGDLKSVPGHVWEVPSGDGKSQRTELGQLNSANLENYLQAIDNIAQSVAIITRTPRHYFWGQTGPISGEALIALESPLNKKVQRYLERFESSWQEIGQFILQLEGHNVERSDIILQWDRPETVQPKTASEIRGLDVQSGLPLITALRREGWTEAEIQDMLDDAELERETLGVVEERDVEEEEDAPSQRESIEEEDDGEAPE